MNAAGGSANLSRLLVFPILSVGPGNDSPSAGLGDAEDGDGPGLDAELDRDPVACLPMVDPEATQHRLAATDGDVSGSVVAHQDKAIVEVHRVELRERTTGSQRVHHLHGDGVLEVSFPGGRNAASGEQRVSEYETCAEPLVDAAACPPVVIGEGVEVEVCGEAVETGGDASRPFEVFLVNAFFYLEGLARLFELRGDGFSGNILHAVVQIVHLQDLDVEAELGVVHGEV
jgi:hypothetical protein